MIYLDYVTMITSKKKYSFYLNFLCFTGNHGGSKGRLFS